MSVSDETMMFQKVNDVPSSYNNARSMIRRLDRDELIEELVNEYVKAKKL